MDQRNWLDLSRKLVDRLDLDYTISGAEAAIGKESLCKFGQGIVLDSKAYPVPFVLTPSGVNLNVGVSAGQAHDNAGQLITMGTPQTKALVPDGSNPRWSLLVLRHKFTGSTSVPKPSDPILTVFLNLLDDFDLILRSGAPSGSPSYPATVLGDVVIAGFKIPAAATNAAAATIDYSVSQFAPIGDGEWDAVTGLSDATLKDALTRLNGNKKKILCAIDENLATTVAISKDDIVLGFKPGVTLTNTGANTALNVSGARFTMLGGRFKDFSTTALNLGGAALYANVIGTRFKNCTDEITDGSGGTVQAVATQTES